MAKSKSQKQNKIPLPRSVQRLFPNVDYAVDATDSIELSVNRSDCKGAKKLDPTNCAMARAAQRELHADAAIIGISTSYIIKNNVATRYQTPDSVRSEIVSFDRHSDFTPGDYYLIPKSPSTKFGTGKPGNTGRKNKTAKRKVHHSARVRILAKG